MSRDGKGTGPGRLRRMPVLALGVHRKLLAHDLLIDAGPNVLFQNIGERNEQLIDAFILDEFLE